MTSSQVRFPVHVRHRIGLNPIVSFAAYALMILDFWARSQPGYTSINFREQPISPGDFLFILKVSTGIWLLSLLPWFPVSLEIDERGITHTVIRRVSFTPWSEIIDIAVSDKNRFFVRGGAIRFVRRGEAGPRNEVDISPRKFGFDRDTLAGILREGLARLGPAVGRPDRSSTS